MKKLTVVSLRAFILSLIYLLSSLSGTIALAHDVKGTVIYVDLWRDHVSFQFEMPVDELSLAYGKNTEPGITALPAPAADIAEYVLNHTKVQTTDGKAFTLTAKVGESILHDSRNWQQIIVDAVPPDSSSPREYTLITDVINHQVVSHHIFIFLRSDFETGQIGEPVYLDSLHYQIHESHFKRAPGSLQTGLWSIFRLGMSHIAEGTDHLLFLFTLLLPAGLLIGSKRRWAERGSARKTMLEIAKIVTAFTIGHSITLLAGSLGIASLPSQFVESMIAASVLISAAHAVYPIFPGKEALIALVFGLIHGLGFASAMHGLGVDGGTLILTVLGFNLGVEVMQVMLVLITLPWIYLLNGSPIGPYLRSVGGIIAFIIAAAWLGERSLGIETSILSYVDLVAKQGLWLLIGLIVLTLLSKTIMNKKTA